MEAVRKWMAKLSLTPGELSELAEKALGQPFDVDALWAAMICEPMLP
jgi:hypothetical protein